MKAGMTEFDQLIAAIENEAPQQIKTSIAPQYILLKEEARLVENLSGWIGALVLRALLKHLHLDEHYLFRWRVENKFIQYKIFNYYRPDCMPVSYSLSELYQQANGLHKIRFLIRHGYFLKATLGHGSLRTNTFDRTTSIDEVLATAPADFFFNEKWILQKKLVLNNEYRIHSFGREVITGLSFITAEKHPAKIERVESYIEEMLALLPIAFTTGALIAWDVGITAERQIQIIEANFTGFHPEYARGFQTTGNVDDEFLGPVICARLNAFLQRKYRLSIRGVEETLLQKFPFLNAFLFYTGLFAQQQFERAKVYRDHPNFGMVLFFQEGTEDWMLRLITYLLLIRFADKYRVIVGLGQFNQIKKQLKGNLSIEIIFKEELFDIDQYQVIQLMSPERQRIISIYFAFRQQPTLKWIAF